MIVDKVLDTCISGGVELLGLHATVAPRRQQTQAAPVLEEFHFVPYFQSNLADRSTQEYTSILTSYLHKHMGSLLESQNGIKEQLRNVELLKQELQKTVAGDFAQADLEKFAGNPKCSLLHTLQSIFGLPLDENFTAGVEEVVKSSLSSLGSDQLLCMSVEEKMLKTCLDVVLENCGGHRLKIVEHEAANEQMFKHIIPQLSSQPMITLDYTATGADSIDSILLEEYSVKTASWDVTSDTTPNQLANADLVVFSNNLHLQSDLTQALKSAANVLKENGFILVREPSTNLAIPLTLEGLTSDLTTTTDQRTSGPFCDSAAWESYFKEGGFEVVAKKDDGLLHTVFLCRKVSTEPLVAEVLAVDDMNFGWVEELKVAMATDGPANERLWLKVEGGLPHSGVVGMVNCLKQEEGGHKIRCVVKQSLCSDF